MHSNKLHQIQEQDKLNDISVVIKDFKGWYYDHGLYNKMDFKVDFTTIHNQEGLEFNAYTLHPGATPPQFQLHVESPIAFRFPGIGDYKVLKLTNGFLEEICDVLRDRIFLNGPSLSTRFTIIEEVDAAKIEEPTTFVFLSQEQWQGIEKYESDSESQTKRTSVLNFQEGEVAFEVTKIMFQLNQNLSQKQFSFVGNDG